MSIAPFTVAAYSPWPARSALSTPGSTRWPWRTSYPVTGHYGPRHDALELTWMTPRRPATAWPPRWRAAAAICCGWRTPRWGRWTDPPRRDPSCWSPTAGRVTIRPELDAPWAHAVPAPITSPPSSAIAAATIAMLARTSSSGTSGSTSSQAASMAPRICIIPSGRGPGSAGGSARCCRPSGPVCQSAIGFARPSSMRGILMA